MKNNFNNYFFLIFLMYYFIESVKSNTTCYKEFIALDENINNIVKFFYSD